MIIWDAVQRERSVTINAAGFSAKAEAASLRRSKGGAQRGPKGRVLPVRRSAPREGGYDHLLRVALVHDWLTGMRGGEKALEVFCELYPAADLLRWSTFPAPRHR